MEGRWLNISKHNQICSTSRQLNEVESAQAWLQFAARARGWRHGPLVLTQAESDSISMFRCSSDGRMEFIEPLTGMARHPFAKLGCKARWPAGAPSGLEVATDNTSYLILQSRCEQASAALGAAASSAKPTPPATQADSAPVSAATQSRQSRSVLYDLGCGGPSGSSVGRASIAELAELYSANCIDFDRVYAWELTSYNASEWWDGIPLSLRTKVAFFNMGVEKEPTGRPESSFLHFLRASAMPDDFVVSCGGDGAL